MLALRTDKPEAELYLYRGDKQLAVLTWTAHRELAETIHSKIASLLEQHQMVLTDVEHIVVYQGPGSFTGLRIGISVANALSYGLGIPISGGRGENWLRECISSTGDMKPLEVMYGSDPHITQRKK